MSIGLHVGWDFTETSILGVDNSHGLLLSTPKNGRSDILTGGSFGPDASVLSYIIGIIAVTAILYARKKGWFTIQQDRRRKAGFALQGPTTPL
jgi:hypothetical protein